MAFSVVASYSSPLVRPLSSAARFELVYAVSEAALVRLDVGDERGECGVDPVGRDGGADQSAGRGFGPGKRARRVLQPRPSDAHRRDESLAHGPRPW